MMNKIKKLFYCEWILKDISSLTYSISCQLNVETVLHPENFKYCPWCGKKIIIKYREKYWK